MHDSPGTSLINSDTITLFNDLDHRRVAFRKLVLFALYPTNQEKHLIEVGCPFPVTVTVNFDHGDVRQFKIIINDKTALRNARFKHLIPEDETQIIAAEIGEINNEDHKIEKNSKQLLTISTLDLSPPQITPHHIVLDQNIEPEVIRKTLAGLDFAIAQHIITHRRLSSMHLKARNFYIHTRETRDLWSTYYNSADVLKDLQSNPIHQNSYKAAEAILGDSIKHYITEALANLDWVEKCQKLDLAKLTPDSIPKSGVRTNKLPLNEATLKESVSHYITDVFTNLDGVENCQKLSLIELITNDISQIVVGKNNLPLHEATLKESVKNYITAVFTNLDGVENCKKRDLIELITNDITQIVAESNKLPLNEAILSIKPFDVITITSSKPNKLLHLLSTRPNGLRHKPVICLPHE